MRIMFLIIAIFACTPKKPPSRPESQRNFVCERFAEVNPKAICRPEYTDVGERHTYSATIIVGNTMMGCSINTTTLGVICGDAIVLTESDKPHEKPPESQALPPPSDGKAPEPVVAPSKPEPKKK